jgi:polysaccharide export outer membrane protein
MAFAIFKDQAMTRLLAMPIAAALVICIPPQSATAAPSAPLAEAALASETAASQSVDGDYRIEPEDVVEIDVFQLADLHSSVVVDSAGKISLPLVGQIQAGGLTALELSKALGDDLKTSYVRNPQVTVIVKDAKGRRITIDGAVSAPGIYPLTGPTTLMQAVAMAKGPDVKFADLHRVVVFRMVGNQRTSASYDLAAIRSGKSSDPAIYGKDVIVVNTSGAKSVVNSLGGIAPILSVLRWGY